jgi:fructose-specific phosphotransferase system component IIB
MEGSMLNETLEERADEEGVEVEIEANKKGTAAQIEVKELKVALKILTMNQYFGSSSRSDECRSAA